MGSGNPLYTWNRAHSFVSHWHAEQCAILIWKVPPLALNDLWGFLCHRCPKFPVPYHITWFLSSLRFGRDLLAFSISGAPLHSRVLNTKDSLITFYRYGKSGRGFGTSAVPSCFLHQSLKKERRNLELDLATHMNCASSLGDRRGCLSFGFWITSCFFHAAIFIRV